MSTYHKIVKSTQQFLISGRVQGVSFRYFTKNIATQLALVGWTRNLIDGRVEVLVQGSESQLEKLVQALKVGPPHAQVTGIDFLKVKCKEVFVDFGIREDGHTAWEES